MTDDAASEIPFIYFLQYFSPITEGAERAGRDCSAL